jgi:hypothetical protein
MCAELADLGMQLARAVAARALTDWTEPREQAAPEPAPSPAPEPRATPSLHTAGATLRTPTCKPIDPALLFTRLAATVRDCIALEARLAAGPPPSSRAAAQTLRADPRRAPLREAFHQITEDHPDRAELRQEIDARLDETLAADATQTTPAPQIFFALCDELALTIDFASLPDEYLDFITDPTDPPDPHATSPP